MNEKYKDRCCELDSILAKLKNELNTLANMKSFLKEDGEKVEVSFVCEPERVAIKLKQGYRTALLDPERAVFFAAKNLGEFLGELIREREEKLDEIRAVLNPVQTKEEA